MLKFMSALIIAVLVTSVSHAMLVEVQVHVNKASKHVVSIAGKSHCVKGKIGPMVFDKPFPTAQNHNYSARILVRAQNNDKETIANILFAGPDHPGGYSLSLARGRAIVVCTDGSFIF